MMPVNRRTGAPNNLPQTPFPRALEGARQTQIAKIRVGNDESVASALNRVCITSAKPKVPMLMQEREDLLNIRRELSEQLEDTSGRACKKLSVASGGFACLVAGAGGAMVDSRNGNTFGAFTKLAGAGIAMTGLMGYELKQKLDGIVTEGAYNEQIALVDSKLTDNDTRRIKANRELEKKEESKRISQRNQAAIDANANVPQPVAGPSRPTDSSEEFRQDSSEYDEIQPGPVKSKRRNQPGSSAMHAEAETAIQGASTSTQQKVINEEQSKVYLKSKKLQKFTELAESKYPHEIASMRENLAKGSAKSRTSLKSAPAGYTIGELKSHHTRLYYWDRGPDKGVEIIGASLKNSQPDAINAINKALDELKRDKKNA